MKVQLPLNQWQLFYYKNSCTGLLLLPAVNASTLFFPAVREDETDISKIDAALGYEPELADIIRFKMLQKKMNQKNLAALLNMTEAKASQILSGKREPDLDFLRGIHAKLGIDGNVLLETA